MKLHDLQKHVVTTPHHGVFSAQAAPQAQAQRFVQQLQQQEPVQSMRHRAAQSQQTQAVWQPTQLSAQQCRALLSEFPTWYSQATSTLLAPRYCSRPEWTALQQAARKYFAPQFDAEQPLSISQLADVVGLCCQPPEVVSHAQLGLVADVGLHSNFFFEGSECPLHSDKYQYCSTYQVRNSEQLKLLQLTSVGQDSRLVDLVPLAGLLVLSAADVHVQAQNVAEYSPNEVHRWGDFGIQGSCFGLRYSESSDVRKHNNRQHKFFQYLQDAGIDGWIGCDQPGSREVVLLLTSDKSTPVKCQLLKDVLLPTTGVSMGH